ncbi:MAG TPA: hypothetical protein VGH89_39410 [Pseudonocardia sp.]
MLRPEDDLRHRLAPGPHARESLFHNVLLPDEGLMVFVYTWVDAESRAGHLFAVVGDNNERLAFSAADGVPVGAGDFDDWRPGGVWLRHTDPLRVAQFGAEAGRDAGRATLRAEFTATHEAFDYARNADGCPGFIADNRFEQSGRVTGELTLNGRTIPFDTTGHRDHSWGTRDWDAIQDWKWVSAQVGSDIGINVMQLHARGETTRHGYVYRDGALAAVREVRARAEYDEHWWQTEVRLTIIDEADRRTELTAKRYALLAFEAGARMVLHEAGCLGSIDGRPAPVHFECGWDRSYAQSQTSLS